MVREFFQFHYRNKATTKCPRNKPSSPVLHLLREMLSTAPTSSLGVRCTIRRSNAKPSQLTLDWRSFLDVQQKWSHHRMQQFTSDSNCRAFNIRPTSFRRASSRAPKEKWSEMLQTTLRWSKPNVQHTNQFTITSASVRSVKTGIGFSRKIIKQMHQPMHRWVIRPPVVMLYCGKKLAFRLTNNAYQNRDLWGKHLPFPPSISFFTLTFLPIPKPSLYRSAQLTVIRVSSTGNSAHYLIL